MEQLIFDMLKEGTILPKTGLFSSSLLLVHKKDKTWRFYINYHALNAIMICDQFPIPKIDELHGACCFSKLEDLLFGFHLLRVKATDVSKIAFQTHDGH